MQPEIPRIVTLQFTSESLQAFATILAQIPLYQDVGDAWERITLDIVEVAPGLAVIKTSSQFETKRVPSPSLSKPRREAEQ